ncbi:uncharacterized protein LOC129988653 [Argiope bruennichi]|uniref:Speckle-type POZ protein like n=1 Tax=Argiope bruennichi TaxID=94029 RepID=A0A8T0EEM2_ARGBR|nr:uncharacterized protein LOC129988653 [Argiope bruennichi]KAF8771100.1 Speckle-type POZ protein like [Argiope bruennichi]
MASSENSGFIFTWSIENIHYIALNRELTSPTFIADCLDKTEWRLGVVLRLNEDQKIEKYLQLYKVPTEPYYYPISYEFSVFDASNKKLESFKVRGFRFHRGSSTGESKLYDRTEYFSKIKTIQCRLWANEKDSVTEQGFGHTSICFERRYFAWTIEKFSELWRKTSYMTIESKKCPSKSINLILNTSLTCERKLQVELRNNLTCKWCYTGNCCPYPYVQGCEISIVDSKGNVMVLTGQEKWKSAEECDGIKAPKGKSHDKYYFQFPLNSTNKEFVETCVQNDSLSFRCECDICFGFETSQLENAPKECTDIEKRQDCDCCKTAISSSAPPTNFMEEMQQLLAEKQFCDFTLKTEIETFPVHKAILSVRSPVFKAIFSHDMRENTNQNIDIPDLNAATVRRMFVYIYTDKIDNISWNDAFDLYIAGDKYQMLNLKERCSFILKSNLHPSNACEILVLADERHDEELKKAAEDYIIDHDVEIIRMDAWKDIEKNNPSLGVDILRQIVIKRQKV